MPKPWNEDDENVYNIVWCLGRWFSRVGVSSVFMVSESAEQHINQRRHADSVNSMRSLNLEQDIYADSSTVKILLNL